MYKFARLLLPGLRRCASRCALPGRLARDTRGTSAVEVALVMPVFLLLLVGIVEFGRALKHWNEVQYALGKAIRLIHLETSISTTEIVSAMKDYLSSVDPEDLAVTATPTTVTGVDYVKIEVAFPFRMHIPFSDQSSVNISVDAMAPVLSPVK